jgi:hypothetical protein
MSSNPSLTRVKLPLGRPPATTARGQRLGVVASVAFHGLIAAAVLISFRNFRVPEESHAVPVDLVTIAEQTNVAAQAPPKPPEPEKLDIPEPVIEQPELPDFQEAEPAPDIEAPKFEITPEKPPPEKSKPETKKTKKPAKDDFAALLNKLTAPVKTPKNARPGTRVIKGVGNANLMTADLADALRSQIRNCWSPPIGAPDARDLVVDFNLMLNPDGSVGQLSLTPGSAMAAAGNSYTRASAEAASRAIYQCQPYHLPQDRYSLWRQINPLRFDPRQMMEQ